ncbi:type IV pilin protein [Psychrobacter sp. B38]|uniref:type IV pilin protein n=1 Tax=Psychrobacter sp. B38 TaxID=3143538 RepID=UPI00320FC560
MHHSVKKSLNNQSGFTLIELMITVTIIAILAAIALPVYTSYIKRTNIKAAQTDLISLGLVLENHYQRNLSYPNQDYVSTTTLSAAFPQWSPSKTDIFGFSSTKIGNGTGYTLIATADTASNLNGCILTLTNNNIRTATSSCEGGSAW